MIVGHGTFAFAVHHASPPFRCTVQSSIDHLAAWAERRMLQDCARCQY